MTRTERIVQIVPAVGWWGFFLSDDGKDAWDLPVAVFALVEYTEEEAGRRMTDSDVRPLFRGDAGEIDTRYDCGEPVWIYHEKERGRPDYKLELAKVRQAQYQRHLEIMRAKEKV